MMKDRDPGSSEELTVIAQHHRQNANPDLITHLRYRASKSFVPKICDAGGVGRVAKCI